MLTNYANENNVPWLRNTAKAACFGGMLFASTAHALTADDVLNKMNDTERNNYIAGVVGGFAYSRFLRDRPDKTGMNCFYDWLYKSEEAPWDSIISWFARHPDKPVEPLLYVLIKKDCGD